MSVTKIVMKNLSLIVTKKDIAFVIGPEGGFELNEISELKTLGFKEVSLGKRILC